MKDINVSYSSLKDLVTKKGLVWQYLDRSDRYEVFGVEDGIRYWANIWKANADIGGIDPVAEAVNLADFDANYKSAANSATDQWFRPSYAASAAGLTPALLPTDIFYITGSATKIVRVHRIYLSGNATDVRAPAVRVIKRSTANTGGTSAALAAVPFDSAMAAATATVRTYTVNPTSLGTQVGILLARRLFLPAASPLGSASSGSEPVLFPYGEPAYPIVLRGTSEWLTVNLAGVTIAGANLDLTVEWSED